MMGHNISIQTIAMLALLEGKEEADALLPHLAPAASQRLSSLLSSIDPQKIPHQLKALFSQETFSGIAEIHPAWLVEALKKESPRVIGVILRHLPSKHVRYLLEHLPKRTVMQLPKLIEAFYVPQEILELVRLRFERHFVPMRISHQLERFSFEHLYFLKTEELESLFYDLGLSELALSLQESSRKIWKIILNRFSIPDAKEILHRIKEFGVEEKWLAKDARYSILELKGKEMGAKSFLIEVGVIALAKAFSGEDIPVFECLRQKLSPENAYLLKRYLDEQILRPKTLKGMRRKEWILKHVRNLSQKGKIDVLWQESLKNEEAA